MFKNLSEKTKSRAIVAIAMVLMFSFVAPFVSAAIRTNPIENYVPIVRYNEGIYTAFDITTLGTLTAAIASFTSSLSTADFTATGTTTIARSKDGFIANASFTVATGTTASAVYTNTGSPLLCSDESGVIYTATTGFTPALAVVIGTSTSPTGYSANLMASTTMATSTATTRGTQVLDVTYAAPFELKNGESITAVLGDVISNASSTNYANRTVEFGFHCWAAAI